MKAKSQWMKFSFTGSGILVNANFKCCFFNAMPLRLTAFCKYSLVFQVFANFDSFE